jgi:hypothetical protein
LTGFPFLEQGTYRETSPATPTYNCIAWAAGEDFRWWWPTHGVYYWPKAAPLEETVESFVLAFRSLSYETCDNGDLERGWDKVAIYADDDSAPTHMARQLPNGKWTSKLGSDVDIEHTMPHEVEGPLYGRVVRFLKRRD